MIFQYNALDYVIETSAEGELIFSIGRQDSAAPKLRYNLHDLGGTLSYSTLNSRLGSWGLDTSSLATRQSSFPILYVFGRSDLTAPFYGAKVYPTDIEEIINSTPHLARNINCFQIVSYEDASVNKRLKIRLESAHGVDGGFMAKEELHKTIFDGLCRVNQDFREVTKMFDPSAVEIELFPYGTGPFAERDIRVKNKYINSQ
jgi:phenylacetate-CoA ligase